MEIQSSLCNQEKLEQSIAFTRVKSDNLSGGSPAGVYVLCWYLGQLPFCSQAMI